MGVRQPAANPTCPAHWAVVAGEPPDMLLAVAVVGFRCRHSIGCKLVHSGIWPGLSAGIGSLQSPAVVVAAVDAVLPRNWVPLVSVRYPTLGF